MARAIAFLRRLGTRQVIHCLTVLQIPNSYIPYGEHGAGLFSSKVLNSLDSMKELTPIALDCVRSFQVNPSFAFTIADYGSPDGGNSMPLIYACVEELRKLHGSALEILIFYEDQPTNDFTSVFSILQGTRSLQTNSKHFKSSHLYLGRIPHQPRAGTKYPSMFSLQMETLVFIILQIFYATQAVLKIGLRIFSDIPQF